VKRVKKISGLLSVLWSSTKGKVVVVFGGAVVVGVVVLIVSGGVASTVGGRNESGVERSGNRTVESGGTSQGGDLFATLPPAAGRSPQPGPNGQIEIGGPGIPANTGDHVSPEHPETTPNPLTGLAVFPVPVPHAKLTVPLFDRLTVGQCASSRVPESRAYANDLINYLYTWDSRVAEWDRFETPLRDLWNVTVGVGSAGPDAKWTRESTWKNRLRSFGFGVNEWANWKRLGVRSEVRVNSVLTSAGRASAPLNTSDYAVRLQYDLTVTRSVDGMPSQSTSVTAFVLVYAPCPAEDVMPARFRSSFVNLQAADFGQQVQEER